MKSRTTNGEKQPRFDRYHLICGFRQPLGVEAPPLAAWRGTEA